MVQVIQGTPSFGAKLGRSLGTGLGSGISSGIESLLEQKLKGLQSQKTSRGLEALGFSPQQAQELSGLDAKLLSQVLKSHLESPKLATQQQFLQQQGLPPEITSFSAPAQKAFIQQLLPAIESGRIQELLGNMEERTQLPQQQEQVSENLQQQLGVTIPEQSNVELEASTPQEIEQYNARQKNFKTEPNESFKETKQEIKDFTKAQPTGYELAPLAQATREISAIQKKLNDSNLSARDKSLLEKQSENIEKKYGAQQDKLDKKYEPFVNELRKKSEANQKVNQEVDKLLSLVNSGRLTGPIKGSALETLKHGVFGVGLDLFGVTSPETQEFKKIQTNLLRNIKEWFGARISNQEVQRFMEALPSLNQSDEGKRRVIRDIKLLNQGEIEKKNALEEILSENGGNIPKNLPRLVEQRAAPQLDKIAQEFSEEYISPQQLAREHQVRQRGFLGPTSAAVEDVVLRNLFY